MIDLFQLRIMEGLPQRPGTSSASQRFTVVELGVIEKVMRSLRKGQLIGSRLLTLLAEHNLAIVSLSFKPDNGYDTIAKLRRRIARYNNNLNETETEEECDGETDLSDEMKIERLEDKLAKSEKMREKEKKSHLEQLKAEEGKKLELAREVDSMKAEKKWWEQDKTKLTDFLRNILTLAKLDPKDAENMISSVSWGNDLQKVEEKLQKMLQRSQQELTELERARQIRMTIQKNYGSAFKGHADTAQEYNENLSRLLGFPVRTNAISSIIPPPPSPPCSSAATSASPLETEHLARATTTPISRNRTATSTSAIQQQPYNSKFSSLLPPTELQTALVACPVIDPSINSAQQQAAPKAGPLQTTKNRLEPIPNQTRYGHSLNITSPTFEGSVQVPLPSNSQIVRDHHQSPRQQYHSYRKRQSYIPRSRQPSRKQFTPFVTDSVPHGIDITYSGNDGFRCLCGTRYKSKQTVVFHIRQMTKEWKYLCPNCHQYFFQSSNLKNHLKDIHNIIATPEQLMPRRKTVAGPQKRGNDSTTTPVSSHRSRISGDEPSRTILSMQTTLSLGDSSHSGQLQHQMLSPWPSRVESCRTDTNIHPNIGHTYSNNDVNKGRYLQCHVCFMKFLELRTLKTHMETVHQIAMIPLQWNEKET